MEYDKWYIGRETGPDGYGGVEFKSVSYLYFKDLGDNCKIIILDAISIGIVDMSDDLYTKKEIEKHVKETYDLTEWHLNPKIIRKLIKRTFKDE